MTDSLIKKKKSKKRSKKKSKKNLVQKKNKVSSEETLSVDTLPVNNEVKVETTDTQEKPNYKKEMLETFSKNALELSSEKNKRHDLKRILNLKIKPTKTENGKKNRLIREFEKTVEIIENDEYLIHEFENLDTLQRNAREPFTEEEILEAKNAYILWKRIKLIIRLADKNIFQNLIKKNQSAGVRFRRCLRELKILMTAVAKVTSRKDNALEALRHEKNIWQRKWLDGEISDEEFKKQTNFIFKERMLTPEDILNVFLQLEIHGPETVISFDDDDGSSNKKNKKNKKTKI